MSFDVHIIEGNIWELVFSDEPAYIHALKMAPKTLEPELKSGIWLVVAFPVWSGPVRDSIQAAIACTKQYGGKFHLGVRPFDYYEEMNTWWPCSDIPMGGEISVTEKNDGQQLEVHIGIDANTAPVWLVLKDSQVVHQGAGPRTPEQLSKMMHSIV